MQNDLSEVKDFHQKCLCVTGFINPWRVEGYCSYLVQIGWGHSQLLGTSFIILKVWHHYAPTGKL